ncbi:MAG: peroxiredoxin [Planctomycetales bacterium]
MQRSLAISMSALVLLALAAPLSAGEQKIDLQVGDKAPEFEAKADNGETWKSADVVGQKTALVVYFYPADMTPGCTAQACAFRDDMDKLKGKGVEVVGVSGDSVRNHQLFKKAHNLNFTLLADEDGEVAKKFGVPTGKGATIQRDIDGQKEDLTRGVTAQRWTFVIDKQGKIVHKNTKVNAARDSQAVLEAVEKLEP